MALTLLDTDLQAVLKAGHWSSTAEDNETFYSERLPLSLVEQWVKAYDPTHIESTAGLAVLTLTTAAAAWGVENGTSLPEDPENRAWAGPRKGNDGKHLMSYAVGGVGIDHTDSGALARLFDYLEVHHPDLAPKAGRFFDLRGINFDDIRANGGACSASEPAIAVDLDNAVFGHAHYGAGTAYCAAHQSKANTTREDWQIFRHWIRAALRLEDVQRYIIERWINTQWVESYQAVINAGGSMEEVMINSRIRNSSPYTANCALNKANQVAPADRLQTQLDAYALPACKGKARHKERFGVMLRPVVLYRHFTAIHSPDP